MIRFQNSLNRIDRAYAHLRSFNSEWHSIMDDECARAVARKDKRAGWNIVAIEPTAECLARIESNTLSLKLGEIAYQLRAALDGLMWDAITYTQGTEPAADANGIDFPIYAARVKNFDKCGFHKFPFPPNLTDWLRTIQPGTADKPLGNPDRGLQNTLEDIHNLARFDRHRRLRIVGVVPTSTRIDIESSTPAGGGIVAQEWLETCDIFGGKYDFARIKVECRGGLIPYDVRLKTKITFEISAEDIPPYGGEDVGVQLHRFIQAVEYVISRFQTEFI